MAVHREGEGRAVVPELLLDIVEFLAGGEQEARVGVPQIVQADVAELGNAEQGTEDATAKRVGVQNGALAVGEDPALGRAGTWCLWGASAPLRSTPSPARTARRTWGTCAATTPRWS